jgi:dTDP-4-dehydrorhamnose reductase
MSKPNDCEKEQALCYANNVMATKQLAEIAKKINAYFIFLSTDFVFSNEGFYKEMDDYSPVNYYGISKQLAEEAIIKSNCNYSIIRVVLIYGKVLIGQRPTFLQWVKNNLKANKTMQIYTDQLRTPCYINDLCWAINQLIITKKKGIFHICGNEVFTPFSLAKLVAGYLKLDGSFILPTNSTVKPELAKRPANATLCIDKAKLELGFKPTKMEIGLKEIFG